MTTIIEFPLREEARTLLRAEGLVNEWHYFKSQSNYISQVATLKSIASLHELLKKSHLLEYLELLNPLSNLTKKQKHLFSLLEQHPILNKVRQRLPLLAGLHPFDLPILSSLNKEPHLFEQLFSQWQEYLTPAINTLNDSLACLRENYLIQSEVAHSGYYSQSLDPKNYPWFVQIHCNALYYPELIANFHQLNLRFFKLQENLENKLSENNVTFSIRLCGPI